VTKKITFDILKKSGSSIILSALLSIIIYPEISKTMFYYFLIIQIWLISNDVRLELQKDLNNATSKYLDEI
jgi:hypothetical protein